MDAYSVNDVFSYLDSVGDRKIAVKQVGDCLRAMGLSPTEAEIGNLTKQWSDNEHRISIEDFKPIHDAIKKSSKPLSEERFIECLGYFDRDGSGSINSHELRYMLSSTCEKLDESDVDFLMRGHDDGRGNVNIAGFVQMIMENDALNGK